MRKGEKALTIIGGRQQKITIEEVNEEAKEPQESADRIREAAHKLIKALEPAAHKADVAA